MWTNRYDHVPKSECVVFLLNKCPKKAISNEIFLGTILLSSLAFIFSSPKRNSSKIYYNSISLPWTLAFSYYSTFFCLSHQKIRRTMSSMDNVGLQTCLLGTSNSTITLTTFPQCKPKCSHPGTSWTTNHRFYKALGQLHGPWCKQPLSGVMHAKRMPWTLKRLYSSVICWVGIWHLKVSPHIAIQTHPPHNTRSLLDAWTLVSKEPMYGLVHPSPHMVRSECAKIASDTQYRNQCSTCV